ncbi:MAG: hypothetical protein IJO93_06345 [Clostridia bacterium]|nr:hypothetical protein [Clostridia bacterium]
MTLNEIIAAALTELGRGHDARSMDSFRKKFTNFANDALYDLAASFKLHRTEQVRVDGSTVDTRMLSRECLKVLAITQDGFPLRFSECEASGIVCVRGTGLVDVTYRYMPDSMSVASDEPEIPHYLHGLIICYVVGRERMSGDTSSQKGANAHMQVYETEKMRIMSASTDGNDMKNKW